MPSLQRDVDGHCRAWNDSPPMTKAGPGLRTLFRRRSGEPRDAELVAALRGGDEAAFRALIDMYNPMLLRVATMYVSSRAVAEEVVQETWLGVLKGVGRFEGRSSLKTWIFRILV